MPDLASIFPSLLLGAMIAITLILLPLINHDEPERRSDEPDERSSDTGRLKSDTGRLRVIPEP